MTATAVPSEFTEVERSWRPTDQQESDVVTTHGPSMFAAILDQPPVVLTTGDVLPPLWDWFLFRSVHRQADLGEDGHPRHGYLLPPISDRRRVFGGGRLEVRSPLRCGDRVNRTSSVIAVRTKVGATGALLIVTIRRELSVGSDVRIVQEEDVVYRREASSSAREEPVDQAGELSPTPPDWHLQLQPDPRLLFRFSALTTNAHRIHYDRPYATEVEGHPGLVVHGPLLALLLLELPRRHDPRVVRQFAWRARRPIYDHDVIDVAGTASGPQVSLTCGANGTFGRTTGTAMMGSWS